MTGRGQDRHQDMPSGRYQTTQSHDPFPRPCAYATDLRFLLAAGLGAAADAPGHSGRARGRVAVRDSHVPAPTGYAAVEKRAGGDYARQCVRPCMPCKRHTETMVHNNYIQEV